MHPPIASLGEVAGISDGRGRRIPPQPLLAFENKVGVWAQGVSGTRRSISQDEQHG